MKCFVTLPIVLHGCETWSFTLRNEHSLRVFENRVLRKGRGNRECRKPRNKELIDFYCWAGHVACMGDRRIAYRIMVGDLMEGDQLEYLGLDGRIILK